MSHVRKFKRIYGTSKARKTRTSMCKIQRFLRLKVDNFPMNMFDIFLIFAKKIGCQMNILANISNLQTQTKGRVNLFNAERHA